MLIIRGKVKQTKPDVAQDEDGDQLSVFLCQRSLFKLTFYTIFLGFCGQISPGLLRFLLKNSSVNALQSILVEQSAIKIQQCSIIWQQKTRKLAVVHWQIVCWFLRFLLQTHCIPLDRYYDWAKRSFCCHRKKWQKKPSAEWMQRINDLCFTSRSQYTAKITNQYQCFSIACNTVRISTTHKEMNWFKGDSLHREYNCSQKASITYIARLFESAVVRDFANSSYEWYPGRSLTLRLPAEPIPSYNLITITLLTCGFFCRICLLWYSTPSLAQKRTRQQFFQLSNLGWLIAINTLQLINKYSLLEILYALLWLKLVASYDRVGEKEKATWIISLQVDKQGQVVFKTEVSYFSLLQAYYVNHKMSLQLFEGPPLSHLIKSDKRVFSHTKTVGLLITRNILLKTTRY